MNYKILVLGRGGQLASELYLLMKNNPNWLFFSKTDLDITDKTKVINYFKKQKIDYVINCAAYTAVDDSENKKKLAFKVNAYGVRNIIEACSINKTKLIHFSTDYVFDGKKDTPYDELSITNPNGIYGKSKVMGEEFIIKNKTVKSIIIRTSWLYSSFGNNFVKTMIRLSKEKNEIGVIDDQIGSPTYARDLALDTVKVVNDLDYKWLSGDIFHYSNYGKCSWYNFAKKIFQNYKAKIILRPLSTKEYPTKATRPKYSLLNKEKFEKTFKVKIRNWDVGLIEMLKLIK